MELFKDVCPKTTANFLNIAKGYKTSSGKELSYKGSIFHRIIPGFMC